MDIYREYDPGFPASPDDLSSVRAVSLRRPGYSRLLALAAILTLIMMAEEPRCEPPDYRGPDGWRISSTR